MDYQWQETEKLDVLSLHDYDALITSECGKYTAIGHYSCGELIAFEDVEETNDAISG